MKKQTISIIGDGGWGTTLALHLNRQGHSVVLWGAFEKYVQEMQRSRENVKFLPGFKLPKTLAVTADLNEALSVSDYILLASPSQFLSSVLKSFPRKLLQGKKFISVVKGIELETHLRMSEVIRRELGRVPLVVLSGPTIAKELAALMPTSAVVAGSSKLLVTEVQKLFNSPEFRIYTNNDVIGVEVGGSIKNVIAIACGICDGLGFGANAKSAIVSRGLYEMATLGRALGAKQQTFYGLSGLGDLCTTCFSVSSRNRSVGELIGQGKTIKQILSKMNMVAEGVETAKAAYQLAQSLNIDLPITTEVYRILFQDKSPHTAVSALMSRAPKPE